MPFAGTRQNQEAGTLDAAGMPGAFAAYNVKFTDTTKPDGQIWAGVVGAPGHTGQSAGSAHSRALVRGLAGHRHQPNRKTAAAALTQSIRPWTPPPPPPPDPNAPPPAGGTNAPG